MQDGGMSAIQAGDEVVSAAEHKALQKKVKQLEQLLGRKTMETEILKEALEIAQSKKLISRMPLLPPDGSYHKNCQRLRRVAIEPLSAHLSDPTINAIRNTYKCDL